MCCGSGVAVTAEVIQTSVVATVTSYNDYRLGQTNIDTTASIHVDYDCGLWWATRKEDKRGFASVWRRALMLRQARWWSKARSRSLAPPLIIDASSL